MYLFQDFIAQATNPSASPTEVIELLKESNKALSDSFSQFIDAMRFVLVVLGILGGVITFIFGKNLNDARQVAKEAVTQEVNRRVRDIVDDEIARVQRLLDPERVVSDTDVDYIAPQHQGEKPEEVRALKIRGFRRVEFKSQVPSRGLAGHIAILDMVNTSVLEMSNDDDEKDQLLEEYIKQITQLIPDSTILIAYVNGHFNAVSRLFKSRKYAASANMPVRLISTVADSAYLAYSLRNQ
ncbi:MAG: hypothetical protein EA367_00480 [Leptolyngbya sp. DLM2.Bin15]|nr:MAG: hypothetical protein EA367_00480 [Leptolyngbya sp. DLM2.Bin15]